MKAEIRKDIKGIDRFIFENGLDNSKLHMHISEVAPNQSMHAPHQHEGQEIFYVFSGKGEVLFGDQSHILKKIRQFSSIAKLYMVFATREMYH